jgi:hypothetical protein
MVFLYQADSKGFVLGLMAITGTNFLLQSVKQTRKQSSATTVATSEH